MEPHNSIFPDDPGGSAAQLGPLDPCEVEVVDGLTTTKSAPSAPT